jgi:hypothetical protein
VTLKTFPNQQFQLFTDVPHNQFMRFVLQNIWRKTDVELLFAQNDFLMTIPYNATTQSGLPLDIKTQPLDWEVSVAEL